ncbi:MAG: PilN domain-containing protein [Bdellovibrionales bacterium]
MIKVNLLRNRVMDTTVNPDANLLGTSASDQRRDSIVKILAISMFVVGMMIYESQNIRSLNEEANRANADIARLTADNTARQAEVLKVKDVEVQAKELEDKLKILKLLSRLRLREVKTLDFMQSSIPEKVWLKSITYDSDKIHVEAGHFQFTGFSVATEELTEFVRRLEDSAYLMDVIVVRNQEVTAGKSTVLRDFMFTAEVETKN